MAPILFLQISVLDRGIWRANAVRTFVRLELDLRDGAVAGGSFHGGNEFALLQCVFNANTGSRPARGADGVCVV